MLTGVAEIIRGREVAGMRDFNTAGPVQAHFGA